MLEVVNDDQHTHSAGARLLDEIVRDGEWAVAANIDARRDQRDEHGRRLVFRNGWRAVHAPHFVALVRAGATFENGELAERPYSSANERVA